MRYLRLGEVLELHRRLIATSGGSPGLRDLRLLEGSLSQLRQTFSGVDLYPTLFEKAAVLGFSLIKNHPFVDGNKRVGHAALEVMLMLNGYELTASKESTEAVVLAVASGMLDRQAWTEWVKEQIKPLG
ncbi:MULTISPECIES: type II toxin-antitoxin system death-on-curing family toxin [unclassified Cyanobium]|jgi:death-on-curing protein|uniref:type II toxin-antitoxin system death-on-curing family toxin n=1 Tax=unclassified Cyanobium TaxID=2627006 RepID=UPI0020CDAE79|nr:MULTISPECIES: type II toxin-antitoxin system death-on-curing family toxin [unclassified Cyanobium]